MARPFALPAKASYRIGSLALICSSRMPNNGKEQPPCTRPLIDHRLTWRPILQNCLSNPVYWLCLSMPVCAATAVTARKRQQASVELGISMFIPRPEMRFHVTQCFYCTYDALVQIGISLVDAFDPEFVTANFMPN